jgi:uncharacterized protein (TIGR03382 family)
MLNSIVRWSTRAAGLALIVSGMASVACAAVPEVDPASASSALALVVGAALLARDKFRR